MDACRTVSRYKDTPQGFLLQAPRNGACPVFVNMQGAARLAKSGRVAQVVEQCPFKAWVAGSNPAALTRTCLSESNPAGAV